MDIIILIGVYFSAAFLALWMMVFRLPSMVRHPLVRIGLVAATFMLSLFIVVSAAFVALGLLRGGVVPSSYGQVIANVALVLSIAFPVIVTVVAIRKYRESAPSNLAFKRDALKRAP